MSAGGQTGGNAYSQAAHAPTGAGGMGQRRGPPIEGQLAQNPTFGFTAGGVSYGTPGEAEAAMRRQNAPAVQATAPATGQPNAYQQAANYLASGGTAAQNAINMFGNVPTVAAGMATYQNPFTQQVTDRAIADVGRTTAMQQEANKAAAARAGAFGGSRQGLVEAETNAASQRAIGDLSANLGMQGFNTAAQLAQGDIANQFTGASGMLSGAGTLQNLGTGGFNMANTLQQQQAAQGLMQQQMQQQLLSDAMGQFYGFANSPLNYAQLMQNTIGGSPLANNQTSTSQYQPGIFDFLSLGTGLAAL